MLLGTSCKVTTQSACARLPKKEEKKKKFIPMLISSFNYDKMKYMLYHDHLNETKGWNHHPLDSAKHTSKNEQNYMRT